MNSIKQEWQRPLLKRSTSQSSQKRNFCNLACWYVYILNSVVFKIWHLKLNWSSPKYEISLPHSANIQQALEIVFPVKLEWWHTWTRSLNDRCHGLSLEAHTLSIHRIATSQAAVRNALSFNTLNLPFPFCKGSIRNFDHPIIILLPLFSRKASVVYGS